MDFENPSITLFVLGTTGSGKSSLINAMALSGSGNSIEIPNLPKSDFNGGIVKIGQTIISKTSHPKQVSFPFAGYEIDMIDNPGFDDNRPGMNSVDQMSQILKTISDMNQQGGFHLGLYCISACNTRIFKKELEDIENLCILLGEDSFKFIKIVLTQVNRLNSQERTKAVENFTNYPSILFQKNGVKLDSKNVLWADFDNFDEKFTRPMRDFFDSSPSKYVSKFPINIEDRDSLAEMMFSPEFKKVADNYSKRMEAERERYESLLKNMQNQINVNQEKYDQIVNELSKVNKAINQIQEMSEIKRDRSGFERAIFPVIGKLIEKLGYKFIDKI